MSSLPVRLEFRDGQLVSDEEAVLSAGDLPEVIIWGVRAFRLHSIGGKKDRLGRHVPTYREVSVYVLTGREKESSGAAAEKKA